MYFMPRTNWFCARFAHLSSLTRYAMTALFLSSILCLWYYGLYRHLATQLVAVSGNMTPHTGESGMLASQAALDAAVSKAESALRDYNSVWNEKGIEMLLEYVAKSGLHFISSDIATKHHQGNNPKEACPAFFQDTIKLRVSGTLKQCSRFFSLLADSGTTFVCEQIETVGAGNNLYEMSCVITVVVAD